MDGLALNKLSEGVSRAFLRYVNQSYHYCILRYILFAWQHRLITDDRTLGGFFTDFCDEVAELDWAVALRQLLELFNDISKKDNKKIKKLIESQLQQWIAGLPSYIKAAKVELVLILFFNNRKK